MLYTFPSSVQSDQTSSVYVDQELQGNKRKRGISGANEGSDDDVGNIDAAPTVEGAAAVALDT